MDVLDYMERESAETMRELMRDYAATFDRVARVATALAGGAAALMAYAPATDMKPGLRLVVLGVACAWALLAALLVVCGAVSNRLQSGAAVRDMQDQYLASQGVLNPYDGGNAQALSQVRLAELNRRHEASAQYVVAINRRAWALNCALVLAAAVPLVGALVVVQSLLAG